MNKEAIKDLLISHGKWLNGDGGKRADLRGADLQDADLRWVDLQRADLRDADLRGADLQDADLRWVDLRDANLQGANLQWVDLRWVGLRSANLRGADLDYSCWPLWCGAVGVTIDSRLSRQLVYHAIVNMPEGDRTAFLADPLAYANAFHHVDLCGKIDWSKEKPE